jgi:hypothetical protein
MKLPVSGQTRQPLDVQERAPERTMGLKKIWNKCKELRFLSSTQVGRWTVAGIVPLVIFITAYQETTLSLRHLSRKKQIIIKPNGGTPQWSFL